MLLPTIPLQTSLNRRTLQKVALLLPAPLLAAALHGRAAGIVLAQSSDTTPALAPTPACADADDLDATIAQTEGPYYTPETPERRSFIEPNLTGTRLLVSGYVYTTSCQPVPGALLDFWHCDDAGVYDNVGYRLRGHQFTDDDGRFQLETIVPGVYTGRTRHIHVKAQAPNQPVLTTQLYFPDEPGNAQDGIFDPALVMNVQDVEDGKLADFTFVLDA